jgi:hypothetical protein
LGKVDALRFTLDDSGHTATARAHSAPKESDRRSEQNDDCRRHYPLDWGDRSIGQATRADDPRDCPSGRDIREAGDRSGESTLPRARMNGDASRKEANGEIDEVRAHTRSRVREPKDPRGDGRNQVEEQDRDDTAGNDSRSCAHVLDVPVAFTRPWCWLPSLPQQ